MADMPHAFRRGGRAATLVLVLALALAVAATAALGADDGAPWWPIPVKSYYGIYDPGRKEPGHAAESLNRPKLEEWVPPMPPAGRYTIGVCVPHLKDPYWYAVNYGLTTEARRLGVGLHMSVAGGYGEKARQEAHLRRYLQDGVDGIILAAVSYEGNDQIIDELREAGIPVVEMINDVHAPAVSAKAMVSFDEVGFLAGEFLAEHAERAGLNTVRVAFFPGPRDSGWAPETLEGFTVAMEYFPGKVDIVDVAWGDTDRDVQRDLLKRSLEASGPVDYVVGNALAADAAAEVLRELGMEGGTKVVATYLMPSIYDKVRSGEILAAPSDLNVFQGRMAVDMMVRILNGEVPGRDFAFRSGPFIPVVTTENIGSYPFEGLFGPRDYNPVFDLDPGD